jgi:hypothetical protein
MSARRDRHDLRGRLARLAAAPTPPPDPAGIDATEARLRAIYAAHHDTAPVPPSPERSHRRALVAGVLVATAAVGGLIGVAVVAGNDPGARRDVVLTVAEAAWIELPDGTRIRAAAGDTVPDGARVVVDPGGRATLDGRTLTGGESARVDDGEVELEPTTGPTPTGDTGAPGGSGPTTGPGASATSSGTDATTQSSRTTTSPTTGSATTSSSSPSSPSTTTQAPGTTTTVAPRRDVVFLGSRARVVPRGVRVRWRAYEGPDLVAYLVLARDDGGAPRLGQSDTVVVHRTRDFADLTALVRHRPGMSLRVVAVGPGRVVVAAGKVLRPEPDPTATASTSTTSTSPTSSTAPAVTDPTAGSAPFADRTAPVSRTGRAGFE